MPSIDKIILQISIDRFAKSLPPGYIFYLDNCVESWLSHASKGGNLWVVFSELYPIQIVLMIYFTGLIIIRTWAISVAA